jgi:hypothetical protein
VKRCDYLSGHTELPQKNTYDTVRPEMAVYDVEALIEKRREPVDETEIEGVTTASHDIQRTGNGRVMRDRMTQYETGRSRKPQEQVVGYPERDGAGRQVVLPVLGVKMGFAVQFRRENTDIVSPVEQSGDLVEYEGFRKAGETVNYESHAHG